MNFTSISKIVEKAEEQGEKISKVTLDISAELSGRSAEDIYAQMLGNLNVMKDALETGMDSRLKSQTGMSGGMGYKMQQAVLGKKNITGDFVGEVIANALAISELNACMGKIVAAPTAGSCGILPACLIAMQKRYDFSEEDVVMAMLNASAVGMVIANSATVSGAEGGCQAECGAAAAMAASAMVELMGGTPKMCGHAVAQAIKSVLGLVCDPVAGLVEEPCVVRNASSAAVALVAAELSLAGIESLVPVDEVISAMREVGRMMHESLRETAGAGLANTPWARAKEMEIFGKTE